MAGFEPRVLPSQTGAQLTLAFKTPETILEASTVGLLEEEFKLQNVFLK
jgi:hypothetical protein